MIKAWVQHRSCRTTRPARLLNKQTRSGARATIPAGMQQPETTTCTHATPQSHILG